MNIRNLCKGLGLMVVAVCLIAVAGCKKKPVPVGPDDPDDPDNPAGPTTGYFRLVSIYDNTREADTFYIAGYEAGYYTLLVQTDLPAEQVSVTSGQEWCTTEYGGGTLKFNYQKYGEKNQILQPRTCEIEVKAGTVYHQTFTIAQQSGTKQLGTFDYRNQFYLPADGEPITININTNLWDWQLRNTNDWIEAEHVDRQTLRIAAKPKADGASGKRNGIIYLYSVTEKTFDTYTEGDAYKLYLYDADPTVTGDGYTYGDHTDWD